MQKEAQRYPACIAKAIVSVYPILAFSFVLLKSEIGCSIQSFYRTEVKNLSKNVQFVITKHCENENQSFKDAATDTADLNGDRKQQIEGEKKKILLYS